MRLRRVRGVQRGGLQDLLGDVGDRRTAQNLILEVHVSKSNDEPS
jgi:hypothetical protein